ncbi:MAG: tRNA (N(6)-L-threonylcarbamoyladenosine(37)-C(2))-methylthiotransferase MtaB [Rhodospirillaceae bacterium]|nr:tRNA (N(6)-L-threonylcarbamoyladenosine(37)-C(2))-methylthiotransferase MtaB [Rhodospirillaceae bacterium]
MNALSPHPTVDVISFGCRLNAYESEVMREHALAQGLTDAVIVNTCAVTKEAERQGLQAIRRLKREHPGKAVIAAGCAVQLDPGRYAAMPEVSRALGNDAKLKRESFAPGAVDKVLVGDIMAVRETSAHLIEGFHGRARAFVQVQQGCDHRCTFCIIPFARGNNRSVPMGRIAAEVRALVEAGVREVVITGVDITGYGADLPGTPSLGQMVRRLLAAVPELPRVRLSSLDPAEVDDDTFRLIADEPRLMPHFHLSAQSGDDLILKRMKRRHARADMIAFVSRVRGMRPDAVFGADLIAGFPTETEAMFANSCALVDDCGLTHLHVFPYSVRPGTPAARMPQVPGAAIKARAATLRELGRAALARYLAARVGGACEVLVEKCDEAGASGHDAHFVPVRLDAPAPVGALVRARATGATGSGLIADALPA